MLWSDPIWVTPSTMILLPLASRGVTSTPWVTVPGPVPPKPYLNDEAVLEGVWGDTGPPNARAAGAANSPSAAALRRPERACCANAAGLSDIIDLAPVCGRW